MWDVTSCPGIPNKLEPNTCSFITFLCRATYQVKDKIIQLIENQLVIVL